MMFIIDVAFSAFEARRRWGFLVGQAALGWLPPVLRGTISDVNDQYCHLGPAQEKKLNTM